MGLDVTVLRLDQRASAHGPLVPGVVALPLGHGAEVRDVCSRSFPGLRWANPSSGLYVADEEYAIEFSLRGDGLVMSLHLCIHFGQRWSEDARERLKALWGRIYADTAWQLFADDEALFE